MTLDSAPLAGSAIRLEPLQHHHAAGLSAASAGGADLYRWSPVPIGMEQAVRYIEVAMAWRDAGSAWPYAIIRYADEVVIGSPASGTSSAGSGRQDTPRFGRDSPDACEIGYTWFTPSSIRTAAHTESKLLMLTHAFESWLALRVCFHADVRNARSCAALERIGAHFEGVLRSHRMAADFTARDSARYSILEAEWPSVKTRLQGFLDQAP